mmetsp:Transcript_32006/g.95203  ORF Transcript_32006/g.95203 Transcript_32006/m.95203 type:complete len:247 (-) Transcript_32006:559-1299(-)
MPMASVSGPTGLKPSLPLPRNSSSSERLPRFSIRGGLQAFRPRQGPSSPRTGDGLGDRLGDSSCALPSSEGLPKTSRSGVSVGFDFVSRLALSSVAPGAPSAAGWAAPAPSASLAGLSLPFFAAAEAEAEAPKLPLACRSRGISRRSSNSRSSSPLAGPLAGPLAAPLAAPKACVGDAGFDSGGPMPTVGGAGQLRNASPAVGGAGPLRNASGLGGPSGGSAGASNASGAAIASPGGSFPRLRPVS